jgi:hypothetical protein
MTGFFGDHLLYPELTYETQFDRRYVIDSRCNIEAIDPTDDDKDYMDDLLFHFNNYGVTLGVFKDLFFVRPQFKVLTNSDFFMLKYSTNVFLSLYVKYDFFSNKALFSKVFSDIELSDLFFFKSNHAYLDLDFHSKLLGNYQSVIVNFDVFSTYLSRFYYSLFNQKKNMAKTFYQVYFLKSYFYDLIYWDLNKLELPPIFTRKTISTEYFGMHRDNLNLKSNFYNNKVIFS